MSTFSQNIKTLALMFILAHCNAFPKKATKDNCKQWAEHFTKLTQIAAAEELKKCAEKIGAARFNIQENQASLSKELDKIRGEITQGCFHEEGKNYFKKDADCFLAATKLRDWSQCNFETPFFKGFATSATSFEQTYELKCNEAHKTLQNEKDAEAK